MKKLILFGLLIISLLSCKKDINDFNPDVKVTQLQLRSSLPDIFNSPVKITKVCLQKNHTDLYSVWVDVYGLKQGDKLAAIYQVGLDIVYSFYLPTPYFGNVGYAFALPTYDRGCVGYVKIVATMSGKTYLVSETAKCDVCQ